MKKITFLLIIMSVVGLLLTGCTEKENLKAFDSESEAVEYGIKKSPEIIEILGESKYVYNEKIMVYLFRTNKGEGLGTASLIQKKKKVSWITNGNGALVKQTKGNTTIEKVIESASGIKYDFYAGVAKNSNISIETRTDYDVKPHIDKKSNIYYYLSPVPVKKGK